MNDDIIGSCWHCGRGLTRADFGREQNCPGCRRPTRVCRNCRQFAPGRPGDCAEAMAEPVLAKDRANFCEHFEPADSPGASPPATDDDALLKAAQDLFKN